MPTSSFDTFFACTIIVVASLIALGFLCGSMQARIDNTQTINEGSYLQAIANHIVTNPGAPADWGNNGNCPSDLGLATAYSSTPYELDIDKISMLNPQNSFSLSYFELENSSELNNIALGVSVSQIMDISVGEPTNFTSNGTIFFTLPISTSVNSQPVSAGLNCYVVADSYVSNVTGTTSSNGIGEATVQVPTSLVGNALVIVFARASFDERLTSYSIYNLANSTQETTSSSDFLNLSPLNYTLNLSTNSSDLTIQNCYVFSYTCQQSLTSTSNDAYSIPRIVDESPLILAVNGEVNGTYFQQWVSYPQVPFTAGFNFSGSAKNIFSYDVTINGVLYKLEVSLGDPSP